jgi:hypothetical protein
VATAIVTTKPSASGGGTELSDAGTRVNPIVVLEAVSIEELREQRGLRSLLPLENEMPLARLPSGIYGFSTPWSLTSLSHLSRTSGGTGVLEIHKLESGLHFVGFVSSEDLIGLRDPSRDYELELIMAMSPILMKTHLISLPVTAVREADDRHVENTYVIDLIVGPNR